jgi:phosphinothricin acetyltransferase
LQARPAVLFDTIEIVRIHARCAKERGAVDPAAANETTVRQWLAPTSVVLVVSEGETILGFAFALPDRRWGEAKVAELGVYVDPAHRRKGVARMGMTQLLAAARVRGFWKLLGYTSGENVAFRGLAKVFGLREVGTLEKHIKIDSMWRDVLVVERLLLASRPSNPGFNV